jgi:4-hydroxy-3-methylbut-2-enyl diphosphate reductase
MSVTVAGSAGFCFGVSRAVELVEQESAKGGRVYTLGPIIHNRHVVGKFEALGVGVIDRPEDAPQGSTVIIRSHGVSADVYRRLEHQGVHIVDATCPSVKRIHQLVAAAEEEGGGFAVTRTLTLTHRGRPLLTEEVCEEITAAGRLLPRDTAHRRTCRTRGIQGGRRHHKQ